MSQTEIQSVDSFWGEKTRSEALQSETQKPCYNLHYSEKFTCDFVPIRMTPPLWLPFAFL